MHEQFLFVLSADDNQAMTRCRQFAKMAHSTGLYVDLFFIDMAAEAKVFKF